MSKRKKKPTGLTDGETSPTSVALQLPSSTEAVPLTHSERAHKYAQDIVKGKILACRYIKQAAQRHLDDLKAAKKKGCRWDYDPAKADYVCRFIEMLPHVRGRWAAQKRLLKLEPWQIFIVCCLFGWIDRETRLRKYSEAYLEIPRKNAKSTLAAAICLYLAFADGEYAAEVFCGATTKAQAREVFNAARRMCIKSPEFCAEFGVEVATDSIYREEDGSKIIPLPRNPGDGASPSCAVMDEKHEHKTPVITDTMRTGMGARDQPLLLQITTAGVNIAGPCYEDRKEGISVLAKTTEETLDYLFVMIFTIDEGIDWKSMEAVMMANPNYGISVIPANIEKARRGALNSPYKQFIYKTKHLNIWGGAANGWMNMDKWNACANPALRIEDFRELPCFEGGDLAARTDIASRVKVFQRYELDDVLDEHGAVVLDEDGNYTKEWRVHYYVFGVHYVPSAKVRDGQHAHYFNWVTQKRMVEHPGEEIRLARIQVAILRDHKSFRYERIAVDPWGFTQMRQELEKEMPEGVVIELPQWGKYHGPAMNELEAAVLAKRVHHDGDPVLTWALSNVVMELDKWDNPTLTKEEDSKKIDPAAALVNAIYVATVSIGEPPVFADSVATFVS